MAVPEPTQGKDDAQIIDVSSDEHGAPDAAAATHSAKYHTLSDAQARQAQQQLVAWFAKHRRFLPWRGDAPPYGKAESAIANKNNNTSARKRKPLNNQTDFLETVAEPTAAKAAAKQAVEQPQRSSAMSFGNDGGYGVWVSEVMLQQTRVEAVIPFWGKWMAALPTVEALAAADEDTVQKLWSGLGFYRRSRQLHSGAKQVVDKHGGKMPSTVAELLKIDGIGPYTAGAIASNIHRVKAPIVDGNVQRVLSRLCGIAAPVTHRQATKLHWRLAEQLVQACADEDHPGDTNQSIIELGATVCMPKVALCDQCPVRDLCLAHAEVQSKQRPAVRPGAAASAKADSEPCTICDIESTVPSSVLAYPLAKARKEPSKQRILTALVVRTQHDSEQVLLVRRPDTGLLAGQWEMPCVALDDDAGQPIDGLQSEHEQQRAVHERLAQALHCPAAVFDHLGTHSAESSIVLQRREHCGQVEHIFSHRVHTMTCEVMAIDCADEAMPAVASGEKCATQWFAIADMASVGVTRAVLKLIALYTQHKAGKPTTAAAVKQTKKRKAAEADSSQRSLTSMFSAQNSASKTKPSTH